MRIVERVLLYKRHHQQDLLILRKMVIVSKNIRIQE